MTLTQLRIEVAEIYSAITQTGKDPDDVIVKVFGERGDIHKIRAEWVASGSLLSLTRTYE